MGPSGSGKTTLLDLLSGRKTVGGITGDIKFQGQAPTNAFLKRHTGYVEQFGTPACHARTLPPHTPCPAHQLLPYIEHDGMPCHHSTMPPPWNTARRAGRTL
jgi:Ni2+-binding GTPase involved in maturation of urease and hydrogenase